LPGPKVGWRYGGKRCIEFFGLLPGVGDMSVGITALSVETGLRYAIQADRSCMEDPNEFKEIVEGIYDELTGEDPNK